MRILIRVLIFATLFFLSTIVQTARAARSLVELQTSRGDITLEIYTDQAPVTASNFLNYVKTGFYNGIIFHRVVKDFVIQAGAYDPNLYKADFASGSINLHDPAFWHQPNAPINLETKAGLKNLRGTIAMARTNDPNSATSQFYINVVDNHSLDPSPTNKGYAVFGRVIKGMDVVDDIAAAQMDTDSNVTKYFQNLPLKPITITKAQILRTYDAHSADFDTTPFIHAQNGQTRMFVGQGTHNAEIYKYEFKKIEYLGINCLQWTKAVVSSANADQIDTFRMILAKDTDGKMWIIKYIINENQDNEQKIIDASDLTGVESFTDRATTDMLFKLITGKYNPNNLNDPLNTITTGSGDNLTTQQIVNLSASLAPDYTSNLILTKTTVGPVNNPVSTKWFYYNAQNGLVLKLDNTAGDITGDGWQLAPMSFSETSDDFSSVPFLHVPADNSTFTRIYVGQGQYKTKNYTDTFTKPTSNFHGINYINWKRSWQLAGETSQVIDSFSIDIAKDSQGKVWVFKYIKNNNTVFNASSLLDAKQIDSVDSSMLFRLINGNYNSSSVSDPANTITTGSGANMITEKITSLNDSLSQTKHFTGALIKVKRWVGTTENDNDISYYSPETGLLANFRNGNTDENADGWHLAFYGGTFDDNSDDFSDVPYLNAKPGITRTYMGQGKYNKLSYTQDFSQRLVDDIHCLKWEQSGVSSKLLDNFYMYLARDNMGTYWVFRYYVNGVRKFYATNSYDAKPLDSFADSNMLFRMILNQVNPQDLQDAKNSLETTRNNKSVREEITNFDADLNNMPYLKGHEVLVKQSVGKTKPMINWLYYNRDLGEVLDIANTRSEANDPNYFDPTNPAHVADTNRTAWRLGWYGLARPQFNSDSNDFSKVPFLKVTGDMIRYYKGQGANAGANYRIIYNTQSLLGVSCLHIDESAATGSGAGVASGSKLASEQYLARDSKGKLWLFKLTNDNQTEFAPAFIDQVAPLSLVPDMYYRLLEDNYKNDPNIITGSGSNMQVQTIAGTDETLNLDGKSYSKVVLVKTTRGQHPVKADWQYYDSSAGLIKELWDGAIYKEGIDPNTTGWYQAQPEVLTIGKASFKAANIRNTNKDSFYIKGSFNPGFTSFNSNDKVFIKLGPWQVSLNSSDFKHSRKGHVYSYNGKGSTDKEKLSVKLYLDKGTFIIKTRNANLTGLSSPADLILAANKYYGTATIKNSTGKKKPKIDIPLRYLQGNKDALKAGKFQYVTDDGPHHNYISIGGYITTAEYPQDWSDTKVTIKWGGSTFKISAGTNGLRTLGTNHKYSLKKASGDIKKLIFDLDKCSFRVLIYNKYLKAPPQDLEIKIENKDGTNTIFDQTVNVGK